MKAPSIATGRDCVRPFPIILQKCKIAIESHPLHIYIYIYIDRSISSTRKTKFPLLSSSLCSSVQSICLCQVGHRCHRRLEGDAAGFCVIMMSHSTEPPQLKIYRDTTIQLPGRRFRQFHGPTCLSTANACRMQAQGNPSYLPANSSSHIVHVNLNIRIVIVIINLSQLRRTRWQVFHSLFFLNLCTFQNLHVTILLVYFALSEIDKYGTPCPCSH